MGGRIGKILLTAQGDLIISLGGRSVAPASVEARGAAEETSERIAAHAGSGYRTISRLEWHLATPW
jgi:hypothetical protein